jgi:signal transduction histidine kinase
MPRKLDAHLVGNALVHGRGAERIVADLDRGNVSIRDDGVGISSSIDRDRVEPFLTGDTVSQGTGLGLSIVQEIMAADGGALTIASIPGHGTTASLRFADAS